MMALPAQDALYIEDEDDAGCKVHLSDILVLITAGGLTGCQDSQPAAGLEGI